MKRALLFAAVGTLALLAVLGTSMAFGYHPTSAFNGFMDDPCDAPDTPGTGSQATSDPCGDGDSETQDDADSTD